MHRDRHGMIGTHAKRSSGSEKSHTVPAQQGAGAPLHRVPAGKQGVGVGAGLAVAVGCGVGEAVGIGVVVRTGVGVSSGVGVGRSGGVKQIPQCSTSGSQPFASTHTPGHAICPFSGSHELRGSLAQQRSPGHATPSTPPQPSVGLLAPAPIAQQMHCSLSDDDGRHSPRAVEPFTE